METRASSKANKAEVEAAAEKQQKKKRKQAPEPADNTAAELPTENFSTQQVEEEMPEKKNKKITKKKQKADPQPEEPAFVTPAKKVAKPAAPSSPAPASAPSLKAAGKRKAETQAERPSTPESTQPSSSSSSCSSSAKASSASSDEPHTPTSFSSSSHLANGTPSTTPQSAKKRVKIVLKNNQGTHSKLFIIFAYAICFFKLACFLLDIFSRVSSLAPPSFCFPQKPGYQPCESNRTQQGAHTHPKASGGRDKQHPARCEHTESASLAQTTGSSQLAQQQHQPRHRGV